MSACLAEKWLIDLITYPSSWELLSINLFPAKIPCTQPNDAFNNLSAPYAPSMFLLILIQKEKPSPGQMPPKKA